MRQDANNRLRVLILADECNPEWPSLPIVGYKYARALAAICDVVLVTHIRNRPAIEKACDGLKVVYIDTERLAAPMYKLATFLRGGDAVAWSTGMIMNYLPYLAFERQAWKLFRKRLKAGEFDLVHRITPMSPTLPSYIAHKSPVPFVIGPLNGNLPWPRQFQAEQKREKERLRVLRDAYKYLPFAKSTYRKAACILAGFDHTIRDLIHADPGKIVMMPEIGIDPDLFHAKGAQLAGAGAKGQLRFLYVGRLVPYKLPELVVRAFAESSLLRGHKLTIVGDGPELPRLQTLIKDHDLGDVITISGRKNQAEVAGLMRDHDVFVFPSIRELGAGVVIEAMASGMFVITANYGAPGALVSNGRGVAIDLASLDEMVIGFRGALEKCAQNQGDMAQAAARGQAYAEGFYPWSVKAAKTLKIYRSVLAGEPLSAHGYD
jgi:glycosyltransferase involved in cell wall biosynthesis